MSFGQWASDFLGVPLEERFKFNPLTYFLYSGIDGAWFDPEDMSTMFLDATGTIPVTALEQPVGLWLDKSGNGNHATQSTTASRPTLSARYNLLTKTENFADAVWTKDGITPQSGFLAPDGAFTAWKLTPTSVNSVHRIYSPINQIGSGSKSVTIYVKAAGYNIVHVSMSDNVSGEVSITLNLQTGGYSYSLNAGTWTNISVSAKQEPENWFKVEISGLNNSNQIAFLQIYVNSASSFSGDSVSGILVWHPQLTQTPNALPYQRVNTATDYDSVGWPKYLKFDGVDDYMNLPYMGLYANGASSIVDARDAVSQATDTYIISERSTTDVDPKYLPSRQLASGGNMDSYIVSDEGTVRLDTTGSVFSGTKLAAIRSVVDSGSNIKLFKDGAVVADDNYTRADELTLNNTTIGASVSTTTSAYANMRLYGLIITKSTLSDTNRRRCEQFLASRLSMLGVTLS